MRNIYLISIFILLLFGNCKREVPTRKITFSVLESSADTPSYFITYTSDQAGGTTQVSSNGDTWTSGPIVLGQEQFIRMTVDCNAPLFEIRLSVYVDGHLWDQKNFYNPGSTITISGVTH